MKTIEEFWQDCKQKCNIPQQTRYVESFHFETNEKAANELLTLVLSGKKRATASSLFYYRQCALPLPKVGDYSIVTDWGGAPQCVIQTTAVTILKFKDVSFDVCKREGEDDDLDSWRKSHIRFFSADARECGYVFDEDMPVVFEDFQVVFRI